MKQKVVSFDKDEEGDWCAALSCGHTQHIRHNPPWFNRPWVEQAKNRENFVGHDLTVKNVKNLTEKIVINISKKLERRVLCD